MANKWVKVQDYFRQDSVTLTAGQTRIPITTKNVPQNLTLKLTHFANYCDGGGWSFLTWAVEFNSTPMIPLNQIRDTMGSVSEPIAIEPIDFPPASLFAVVASNSDAVSHTAGVIVRGELGYYE